MIVSKIVDLLEKDNSVSFYQRNLRVLACSDTLKVLISKIFPLRKETQYSLRILSDFYVP